MCRRRRNQIAAAASRERAAKQRTLEDSAKASGCGQAPCRLRGPHGVQPTPSWAHVLDLAGPDAWGGTDRNSGFSSRTWRYPIGIGARPTSSDSQGRLQAVQPDQQIVLDLVAVGLVE